MAMQAAEVQELLEAIEVGIFTGGFLREHIKSSRGGGGEGRTSFQIRGVGCKMHVPKTCVCVCGVALYQPAKGAYFFWRFLLTNFEWFLFFQGVVHRKPWRRGVERELDLLLSLEKYEGFKMFLSLQGPNGGSISLRKTWMTWHTPYHPCMAYIYNIPTFTPKINQM